ncbi:hypothetical protein J5N97_024173 [Dioscorea zingiberensis]|uniref:ARID domain-containing protein n=1 Tax=Dioscorea zingiberensis TaxID=325984 RepID=A0A9D5C5X5_9LILI|nr:hypothetical protein J5N97_024173 [Dioscorea zingiberensis]
MAGLTLQSPRHPLLVVIGKLQSLGFCSDLSPSPVDPSRHDLGLLFDRILFIFLGEIYCVPGIRPLPAMLGDGRPVDLFALYSAVTKKGGYSTVTAGRCWGAVAEEIGMDLSFASSLKLVYVKYLDGLERWLTKVLHESSAGERKELMVGLEKEVSGLILEALDEKNKECEPTPGSGSKRDQFLTPVRGAGRKLEYDDPARKDDDDKYDDPARKDDDDKDDDNVAVVKGSKVANGGLSSLKRKRENVMGMLNWVRNLAKKPHKLSSGRTLSNGSKSNVQSGSEFFNQTLQARKAMLLKKIPQSTCGVCHLQKGEKVHPSIYEDYTDANTQSNEQKRCSQRLRSLDKHYNSGSCFEACVLHNDVGEKVSVASEGMDKNGKHKRNSSLSSDDSGVFSTDPGQAIPVGASFQAALPELTERTPLTAIDADELKWLGTRIWPPEEQETRQSYQKYPIGKGIEETCQCDCPGSVGCVRFHVAEKRLQLKRELGSAFHAWRFNRMGEEVALSWTEEEEKQFKAIARFNPSQPDKCFWEQLYMSFSSKKRQDLVSYYFNVFILRRRSYQNRMIPNDIDSDDDEEEFGFLSKPLGQEVVKVKEPKSTFCAQNTQYRRDFGNYSWHFHRIYSINGIEWLFGLITEIGRILVECASFLQSCIKCVDYSQLLVPLRVLHRFGILHDVSRNSHSHHDRVSADTEKHA